MVTVLLLLTSVILDVSVTDLLGMRNQLSKLSCFFDFYSFYTFYLFFRSKLFIPSPKLDIRDFCITKTGGGERLLTGGNPRVAFFATAFISCFVTLEEEVTGRILYDRSLSLLKDVRHEGYKCTAKIASSSSFTELLSHGCYDYKLPTSCGSLAIQVL